MNKLKARKQILPIAKVLVPDLKDNLKKENDFCDNFLLFFNDLETDSQAKIDLLLRVINIFSLLNFLKTLSKLSSKQMKNLIHKIEHFPIKLIVGGFSGIRSLVMISYYSSANNWQEINYNGPLVTKT